MDFHVVQPSYKPFWRDRKSRPTKGLRRHLIAILSVLAVGFLLVPPEEGYTLPISVQVFRGDWSAQCLFATLGALLAYTAIRLWESERAASAAFCGLAAASLVEIAFTNPFSANHFAAFSFLILMTLTWMWRMQAELEDPRMTWSAVGASVGTFLCLLFFGIGERIVLLSSLTGINVLFYEHILY